MTVESATYINTLNGSLPTSTDAKAEGDDHIRLVKTVLQTTFPNINAAVTATAAGLNAASSVASSGTFPSVPLTGVTSLSLTPSSGTAAVVIDRATVATGQNTLNFSTVSTGETWQIYQQGSSTDLNIFNSVYAGNIITMTEAGALTLNATGGINTTAAIKSTSFTTESLRTAIDNGFISFYNTANSTRSGYLQMNSAAGGATLAAEATGALTVTTLGGNLVIDTAGRVSGSQLHNNASAPTGAATHYIASGTYTPTTTLVANVVTATPTQCQWIRTGNVVTVSGGLSTVTLNASINTCRIGISLPLTSTISSSANVAGTGAGVDNGPANIAGRISGDTVNNRAEFLFVAGSSTSFSSTGGMSFSFTYLLQ